MKSWQDIGFEIEITGDGSPSLRLLQGHKPDMLRGESMHHSGGAWAETDLIYGEPIRETLKTVEQARFAIVGLGLGYIEMTIAKEALLKGLLPRQVALISSFESVPELREFFMLWLEDRCQELAAEVAQTYDHVIEFILRGSSVAVADVKSFLLFHFQQIQALQGPLSEEITLSHTYNCLLYDAFSSKTSPFLWEEVFLTRWISQAAASPCCLSTYACRNSLKNALQALQFEVIVRPGFMGKRNSTLALRS